MNTKILALAILPLILFSFLPITTFAAQPPACGSEMIRYFDYSGYRVKEHKWYCVYNSDFYTVKFYSENHRLLGWQIFKNGQVISSRDFTLEIAGQLPLCSDEMIRYFGYSGYHVTEHRWDCGYNNDDYQVKVYTTDTAGGNILLGWQILKNGLIISSRSFIN